MMSLSFLGVTQSLTPSQTASKNEKGKYMKIKMLNPAIAGLVLALSSFANAGVITYNGYTLDTQTDIVTAGDGLEWLQWDVTKGQSISSALQANGVFGSRNYGAGWALASNAQMASLFNDFGFNSTLQDDTTIHTGSPYTFGSDNTNYDHFIDLFGAIFQLSGTFFDFGTGVDQISRTRALFGSDEDNDTLYKEAGVHSDYTRDSSTNPYHAYIFQDIWSDSTTNPEFGVALVRLKTQVDAPEPSTLAIFALGLSGLILSRRRQVSHA
jgi:hypothetical protein